ncbi:hypothetical protein P7C70_g1029, partial [Phenoliferia sp. Uapishka_3]
MAATLFWWAWRARLSADVRFSGANSSFNATGAAVGRQTPHDAFTFRHSCKSSAGSTWMWSSRSTSQPKECPPTSTNPTPTPSAILAAHRRRSSSNLTSTSTSSSTISSSEKKSSQDKGKGKLRKQGPRDSDFDDVDEDDVWGGDSDDEATRKALGSLSVASLASTAQELPPPASLGHTKGAASSSLSLPSIPRTSSWSFNPFSIIAAATSSPKAPEPLPLPAVPGPEAVAAALAGATVPVAPISSRKHDRESSRGGKGEAAGECKPGAWAEGQQESSDGEERDAAPGITRRGSTYQMDMWKAAIKPDVDEIVK